MLREEFKWLYCLILFRIYHLCYNQKKSWKTHVEKKIKTIFNVFFNPTLNILKESCPKALTHRISKFKVYLISVLACTLSNWPASLKCSWWVTLPFFARSLYRKKKMHLIYSSLCRKNNSGCLLWESGECTNLYM